jgi:NADH:ubiquinone oxidoreductase subunit 6 (subunit J)
VRARRAVGPVIVLIVFVVMLFDDGIPESYQDVLGGLAGLIAVVGVWLAISQD